MNVAIETFPFLISKGSRGEKLFVKLIQNLPADVNLSLLPEQQEMSRIPDPLHKLLSRSRPLFAQTFLTNFAMKYRENE
jgi:hypothetical protein